MTALDPATICAAAETGVLAFRRRFWDPTVRLGTVAHRPNGDIEISVRSGERMVITHLEILQSDPQTVRPIVKLGGQPTGTARELAFEIEAALRALEVAA